MELVVRTSSHVDTASSPRRAYSIGSSMRGVVAKTLWKVAVREHVSMIVEGFIDPPSTEDEAQWQLKRLHRRLKRAWIRSPNPKCLSETTGMPNARERYNAL